MKKIFLVIFILSAYFSNAQMEKSTDATAHLQKIKIDVIFLASDYIEGRETGTRGEKEAAAYIVHRFKELGLSPKGENGTWYQEFPFFEMKNPHATDKGKVEGKGQNVIAYMDNGAKTTVVIGAHYDHLGMGGGGSLHAGEPAIHNGADDNASGVAAMLYIAEYLKNSNLKSNNYIFIGFSGEEKGLFGSKYFAEHPTVDIESINYMLNMDMIGMLNEEQVLAVQGTGTCKEWKDIIAGDNAQGLTIKASESGIGPSDHTSFYVKNIPVLHFFTGQHDRYHKPSDDSQFLNFEGIIKVSDYMISLMGKADGKRVTFTKSKDTQGKKGKKGAKLKVTLGVMPDYVYTGKGMRVDSVIEGRVGHKGGLKDGDVIIKIGDVEVGDIYGYMDGLAKFERGQSADIIVLRKKDKKKKETETKTVKVTFE